MEVVEMTKVLTKNKPDKPLLEQDKKRVDDAVKFINEKANETVYKGSMEIGAYILVDTSKLSYTHKALLVKLDNDIKKINFLKKCIKETCQQDVKHFQNILIN